MMETTVPVNTMPGQNWSCHQSGTCCPTFPHIPVDEAAAAAMAGHDYERLRAETGLEVAGFPEGVEAAPGETRVTTGLRLRRHKGGRHAPAAPSGHPGDCVFHCADQSCGLHKVFGERGKPQLCRDFPYRFRHTPGGLTVGLSFVCPSVRGNKGAALADQHGELARHASEAFAPERHSGETHLHPKLQISWEDYQAVEEGLAELFERPALPIAVRLRALHVAVNMLDLMQQATHGPHKPMEPARPAPDGFIRDAMAALRKDGWSAVLRVAARPARRSMIQRMFLGMMTGFATSLWTPRHPLLVGSGIFLHYARHATGLGAVRLRPLDFATPHHVLSAARFPAPATEAARLLDFYVRHALFRKDLAFSADVRRGVNLLLCNMAMVRWYAAALAHKDGTDSAAPHTAHWSDALRHMESLFGLNSRLHQRLAELSILDAVLESFFRRKEYPFYIMAEAAGR